MSLQEWCHEQLLRLGQPRVGEQPTAANAAIVAELKYKCFDSGLIDLSLSLPVEGAKRKVSAVAQLRRVLLAIQTPAEPQTEWLTVRQAADFSNLSERMVYNLCSRGELTHARVGAAIRIRQTDLGRYLAGQRDRWR